MNNSTTRRTPMPAEATWDDYVAAHGGAEATGWWVTLCWYADSEHPRPEVVGPYTSYEQAVSAMQDSLLIDSFAEDTKREEWLDDVSVATDPSSITRMCAEYGHRVTLVDPGDPHHFGEPDPSTQEIRQTPSGKSHGTPAPAKVTRSALMQAGALAIPSPEQPSPQVNGTSPAVDHSPGSPAV